ncbi:hypothetical protein [Parasaccharibacter sp. TMW2.1890]|uniref:hypothetical protein n=1 Tax=Parasaccharibacter sp. TMW2.1890 TaxID=2039289 RepID=UPI0020119166|nr:hypothetical protein [Parasaccharibacter sp. TMW2.1890]MCL1515243.1 hypothetical protein [Parasaccharibacter sp. TMW2.1890]
MTDDNTSFRDDGTWQSFTPTVAFGSRDENQSTSSKTGGYRIIGNHCDWWATCNMIFKGTSTGPMTMTGLPQPALGGALFGVTVANATGINTDGQPLHALLSTDTVSFFKNQNTGEPTNVVTDEDVENAASFSLTGWYQIEDND